MFLGVVLFSWQAFGLHSLLFSFTGSSHHCLETELLSLIEGGGALGKLAESKSHNLHAISLVLCMHEHLHFYFYSGWSLLDFPKKSEHQVIKLFLPYTQ